MFQRATAIMLLTLLGLFLPSAAATVCLCLGSPAHAIGKAASKSHDCCGDKLTPVGCCQDPECCFVLPELPDGMEPSPFQAPTPVAVAADLPETHRLTPVHGVAPAALVSRSNPPPPGEPARVVFGVWRL